jgi:replicative DNA helicase
MAKRLGTRSWSTSNKQQRSKLVTTLLDPDRLCDRTAEAATLGSMIQNYRVIPSILEWVTASDFFLDEHRAIFEATLQIWHRNPGGELDGALLRSELEQNGALKDIGGVDYLRQVVESTPSSANGPYYAERVAKKARYRQLVSVVGEMSQTVELGGEVGEQIQEVQRLAMSLDCEQIRQDVYDTRQCATQFATDTQEGTTAIQTGYRNLDRLISGVTPGQMPLVGGRPSQGKTTLACGMACNMAQANKRVLIFTLEMTARSLIERMCATLGQVSLQLVKSRHAPEEKLRAFYGGALELAKLPILVVENANTVERQAGVIEAFRQIEPVDVVLIDYLGLMSTSQPSSSRNDEVSRISRDLKRQH